MPWSHHRCLIPCTCLQEPGGQTLGVSKFHPACTLSTFPSCSRLWTRPQLRVSEHRATCARVAQQPVATHAVVALGPGGRLHTRPGLPDNKLSLDDAAQLGPELWLILCKLEAAREAVARRHLTASLSQCHSFSSRWRAMLNLVEGLQVVADSFPAAGSESVSLP